MWQNAKGILLIGKNCKTAEHEALDLTDIGEDLSSFAVPSGRPADVYVLCEAQSPEVRVEAAVEDRVAAERQAVGQL